MRTLARLCMLPSAAATSPRRDSRAVSRKPTYRLLALSWLAMRSRDAATCSYICSNPRGIKTRRVPRKEHQCKLRAK